MMKTRDMNVQSNINPFLQRTYFQKSLVFYIAMPYGDVFDYNSRYIWRHCF